MNHYSSNASNQGLGWENRSSSVLAIVFLLLLIALSLGACSSTPTPSAPPPVATTAPTKVVTAAPTTVQPTTVQPTRVIAAATQAGASLTPAPASLQPYVLLGWNDLGMHCYNKSFADLGVLPPYNTLWAQVIKRGNPPQIVTSGVQVTYSFPGNTDSAGKIDFWKNVQKLFGAQPADNVGLKGKGLTGIMDAQASYFIAEGIPLTEFTDAAPTTPKPYQLASLVAKDAATGSTLAQLSVVAPVSSEMHCDNCHASGKRPGGSQATVEQNILAYHDRENRTSLMTSRPVLCASCHASNALGLKGKSNLPSLSKAIHSQHDEVIPATLDGCYNCHPGPTTQCLRDAMSQNVVSKLDATRKMNCIDCHGNMQNVAKNQNPWLTEPRCDTCHTAQGGKSFTQDQALYRFSTGHGGVYCEACHDSTHAIATSREANDAVKFVQLQGHAGTLNDCTVCHLTKPTGKGPHQ
jgi:hypothetical protein